MKTYLLLIVTLALTPYLGAEEPTVDSQRFQKNAFRRELQQTTDIAIVSPLSTGGYRIVSNLKGAQFAESNVPSGHTTIRLKGRIRDDVKQESQLLVWHSANHPSVIEAGQRSQSLGAAPVSEIGDVTLTSGIKVNLVSMALKPHLIHVNTQGEAAPSDDDRPAN